MSGAAPLWTALLVPVLLLAFGYGAAAGTAALRARAAGTAPEAGLTAPARESARLLVQRRRTIPGADTLLWRLGGALVPVAAVLAALVVPLGPTAVSDLSVGVVWFNAMEVLIWAALWMLGWGADSAWGLVGGYRFLVQGLSYELPHMFALTTAALGAGSLRVSDVVAAQDQVWFAVLMPVAFAVYLLSALAMAFWGPFGTPVGRDLAGGAAAELSGVDLLVLRAGRYMFLAVVAAMAVPLFLGGGAGPLLPGWAWTLAKTAGVVALLVWLGHRLPAVRMDRFTEVAWVVLVPLTLVQALVVAVFVLTR
ncbi:MULTISPECIES: NADH-quinone oxidoreductase subunit H [Nocardiopsis]|jgi:NADH-quinone oxidoreductase subunit H|uniref:NADH dehydrogenase n=1 Tax=Nocardiopsis sinuspersici TaxID=501010 RepID=A0A1V3BY50_9ACTN|nr:MULTISPECIES: NADH-quinone oxidoreductase subunit H [Nocardiopsis]NYH54523.1 NADH-quinone oxidoreductase subunit H [Nocardiopsis sinuspersici]OOC53292.1 NADH dehydrogenase [Nocardiopsis sinuspersici]